MPYISDFAHANAPQACLKLMLHLMLRKLDRLACLVRSKNLFANVLAWRQPLYQHQSQSLTLVLNRL